MLRPRTVTQLLEVLELYRKERNGGETVERALQGAIQRVAERYNVTYQTIGDGCRRRLALPTIEHLHTLLSRWDSGDRGPLARLFKDHSHASSHWEIESFFDGNWSEPKADASESMDSRPARSSTNGSFAIELPAADMSRLRSLAQIMGSTPESLAAKFISDTLSRL